MSKRVGVILSGCGYLDGAEIQESVFSLYFLDKAGCAVRSFAPNRDQMHVVNHLNGEVANERRNVLYEAARITRGEVEDLEQITLSEFDAIVIPGGYGVAKNLSSFATQGIDGRVDPCLLELLVTALKKKTPIVAICISPAVLAMACKEAGIAPQLTIGDDESTAQAIEKCGSQHIECQPSEIVIDAEQRIITTPAYMSGKGPADVASGIEKAIMELMNWLG